jgi:hypothetical protein
MNGISRISPGPEVDAAFVLAQDPDRGAEGDQAEDHEDDQDSA